MTQAFVPLDSLSRGGVGFSEAAAGNPCAECPAPCCRMLLIPHPTPSTFMELDYIRYMLGFPRVNMILNRDGTWQVAIDEVCGFLDQDTNLCTLHATPRKPKTCVFFNPYRCWYKRNFTADDPPDLIRLDQEDFERLLERIRFDEHGAIADLPSWEDIRAMTDRQRPDLLADAR